MAPAAASRPRPPSMGMQGGGQQGGLPPMGGAAIRYPAQGATIRPMVRKARVALLMGCDAPAEAKSRQSLWTAPSYSIRRYGMCAGRNAAGTGPGRDLRTKEGDGRQVPWVAPCPIRCGPFGAAAIFARFRRGGWSISPRPVAAAPRPIDNMASKRTQNPEIRSGIVDAKDVRNLVR